MPHLAAERWHDQISASASAFADLVDGADLGRSVPSCPDWTVRQLATHVGRGHRWAAEIVSSRSADFIPFREVPDGRLPDDPARHASWLREGAARLIAALREAGADPVWAFGPLRPASFWARRMAHETSVHHADAQIAVGATPAIPPDIAADGIDEWLTFLSAPRPGQEDQRLGVLDGGRTLHVHATDDGLGASGEWMIRPGPDGPAVEPGHAKADAAVRGPASSLLLVLVRRLPVSDPAVEVLGDAALVDAWLAATPF